MKDEQFITMVHLIAEKHGCKITNIDPLMRLIEIDGPEEAQVACAIELADRLGDRLV